MVHPPPNDNLIKVNDEYGREMYIDKDSWLNDVLLGNLKESQDNPDALYSLLISAVEDGFSEFVEKDAARLYEIDPIKERGACVYAIILMNNKKLDKAEAVLNHSIETLGETGILLTNLAKVYSYRGDEKQAEATLWRALEKDPNQENAVEWYYAIYFEKGGKDEAHAALIRLSRIDGSWRALLFLARDALEQGSKDAAISFYETILAQPSHLDIQTLQQMSGDLGRCGYIEDIIQIIAPHYKVEQHGFEVGNNLIKAYFELKQFKKAQDLVNQLFAFNRPDWKEGLSYWQNELDQQSGNYGPVEENRVKVSMIPISIPVWLHKLKGLFPKKADDVFSIITISPSCSLAHPSDQVVKEQSTKEGILSRGLILDLCDKINLESQAKATMYLPSNDAEGLVLFGERYSDKWAAALLDRYPANLLILPHLYADKEQWELEFRVYEPKQAKPLKTLRAPFNPDSPGPELQGIFNELFLYLKAQYQIEDQTSPYDLNKFSPHAFMHYTACNENCMVFSLACIKPDGKDSLYGERHMIDSLLVFALDEPTSDIPKLMLLSSLIKSKTFGSEVYKEYDSKVRKLLKDHPVTSSLQSIVLWCTTHLF